MATWPSTLPLLRDGHKEMPAERIERSNMAVGPDKVRRRSSAGVRNVDLRMKLTDAELTTFDDFYYANEGIVFDFTDPRTSTAQRARFAGRPNYNLDDTMWDVSVKMEYLP